ncbi:MAG: hypothetical protein H7325_10515 [Pedobacter sp.]|nr:hypothetical protein [Pedobacter sp.]
MGKKIAINIVYNIFIILSIMGLVWCYNNGKYIPAAFLVGIGGAFIYLKIQLAKDIKKSFKEKD